MTDLFVEAGDASMSPHVVSGGQPDRHGDRAPLDAAALGQVFTPEPVVQAMLALRHNSGRVLEPSCGDGAFSRHLPGCVALEIDRRVAPPKSLDVDFFAYPERVKFATVIGNPPYVRFQDILPATRRLLTSRLFDGRSNLYLFFIEKAVRHLAPGGELIFITPRDFLKTTSSVRLNRWLMQQGSFSDVIELGDARIFQGALPNCLIWRFELGRRERRLRYAEIGVRDDWRAQLAAPDWQERELVESAGHLMFTRTRHTLQLADLASVKVGAVSGADEIYASDTGGNRDFVCAATARSGRTRRMLWIEPGEPPLACLLPHKQRLLQRRVRPFDETNWWHWGRGYPQSDAPRIYVAARTRVEQPFFLHDCPHFDGSVLALFPHAADVDLPALCAALNAVRWSELGFVCDGRYLFTQRSLENAPLPEHFARFLPAAAR